MNPEIEKLIAETANELSWGSPMEVEKVRKMFTTFAAAILATVPKPEIPCTCAACQTVFISNQPVGMTTEMRDEIIGYLDGSVKGRVWIERLKSLPTYEEIGWGIRNKDNGEITYTGLANRKESQDTIGRLYGGASSSFEPIPLFTQKEEGK